LVIFNDADMQRAVPGAAFGLLVNSGQNCCCTSRMYVQRGIYNQFVDGLVAAAKAMRMGGGEEENVDLGPLISEKQRQRVLGIINDGKREGAEILTGGKALDRRGYFVAPTIMANTRPDMRLIREEIFGPVGSVIPFDEEEEVIGPANDTQYGLAATVWTQDISRAHRVGRRIKAGIIWVNCALAADQSMPMGGYKQSGWGYERGLRGLEEYLRIKSTFVGL
jgi:acyl-CoA reductase-like NAD-dependent aldehyde dehydrogenase